MLTAAHLFTLFALANPATSYALGMYECELLIQLGLASSTNGHYNITPLGRTTIDECLRVAKDVVCTS